jgi:cysteinyl-tRNA synthetase
VTVRVYDTKAQKLRDFEPIDPSNVTIYVCGPTVQSGPHIGHLRGALSFDILRRWLTHRFGRVTFVRNVTDIDDKVLVNATETEPWWALAYRMELEFSTAYAAIGIAPPTYEPRATASIPQMQELIARLIEAGHAYAANGDVYFDVRSWGEYGSLTRQSLDAMEPAEDADARGKRDPRDFALWKGFKDGEPASAAWKSPWGAGRPGWHNECSAMAARYLGPQFDIHGGGLDLRVPHHENELAQSTAAGRPFARWWMHNAMLNLGGSKMSKSVGNTMLVSEVVKRVRPIDLRYYLVASHYRSVVEFSFEALEEAAAAFGRIEGFVRRAAEVLGETDPGPADGMLCAEFTEAMDDDLSVPAALAALQGVMREGNKLLSEGDAADTKELRGTWSSVRAMLDVLGLDPFSPTWSGSGTTSDLHGVVGRLVEVALQERAEARKRKDWAAADRVRDALAAAGVLVEDTPTGPRWTLADQITEETP